MNRPGANILTWMIMILVVLGATACSPSVDANPRLRVGMDPSSPPFEAADDQGNPTGISVKLAQALARDLGRELEIVSLPFAELLGAVESSEIDVIVSSMTILPERQKRVDFSEPYVRMGLALLSSMESDINKAEDFNRPYRRIAVRQGTSSESHFKKLFPQAQMVAKTDEVDCVTAVVMGEADAFLYDQSALCEYHEQTKSVTRLLLKPLHIEEWGIAVRKGDKEMLGKVNAFLARFRKDQGFERLAADPDLKLVHDYFARAGETFFMQ